MHTGNFRETADRQLVKETLELIEDLTTIDNGRRLGKNEARWFSFMCKTAVFCLSIFVILAIACQRL